MSSHNFIILNIVSLKYLLLKIKLFVAWEISVLVIFKAHKIYSAVESLF